MGENDASEVRKIVRETIEEMIGGPHFISGQMPNWAHEWIVKALQGQSVRYQNMVPLWGPDQIVIMATIVPLGDIHLELRTSSGEIFWEGVIKG